MTEKSVGTKPRPRTAKERKEKMRRNKPAYEMQAKERERCRDDLYRFHIAREHRNIADVPDSIDTGSDTFKRVKLAYLDQCAEKVEVEQGEGS